MRIAIVEKNYSKIGWDKVFPFEFERFELSSIKKDKLAKKDITLELDISYWDLIIAVGAEPTKFFSKTSNVTTHNGFLIDGKIIPLFNPFLVKMKPEAKPAYEKAIQKIISYASGNISISSKLELYKITETDKAIKYLEWLIRKDLKKIGVDTETTSFYPRKGYILGISISHHTNIGAYISTDCIDDTCEDLLQELFNKCITVFHNGKFDIHFLEFHFGFKFPNFEDTILLHAALDENSEHGLKPLAIKYTDLGDYDRDLDAYRKDYCRKHKIKESDFTYDLFPFDILADYAAIDSIATYRLHDQFSEAIAKSGKLTTLYNTLLLPGSNALRHVENNGIPFNKDYLESTSREIADELLTLEQEIYTFEPVKAFEAQTGKKFNCNSPAQVRTVLYDVIGLNPVQKYTEKGELSTDEEVLTTLAEVHELPKLILKIKKQKKIKATYIDKILDNLDTDGRLRTGFSLHTTTSGRLSSSGTINAQQLPRDDKRPKKAIQARPGFKIISQDLKTAEVFVVACLAKDYDLLATFKRGEDFHGFIAKMEHNLQCAINDVKKLYPELRQEAKNFSFKVLYALDLSHPVLKKFPILRRYLLDRIEEIKEHGYVFTASNRKRRLPNVFSDNRGIAEHYVRSGINALVQSVSSDINLMATIKLVEWIKANRYEKVMLPFMLVHDSIVSEVKEEYVDLYNSKLLEFTQTDYFDFIPEGYKIGVDVEIGDNYAFSKPGEKV
jgi:DNA polymerase I-like protein with 3'-5' exonuclease and polymerase domains